MYKLFPVGTEVDVMMHGGGTTAATITSTEDPSLYTLVSQHGATFKAGRRSVKARVLAHKGKKAVKRKALHKGGTKKRQSLAK